MDMQGLLLTILGWLLSLVPPMIYRRKRTVLMLLFDERDPECKRQENGEILWRVKVEAKVPLTQVSVTCEPSPHLPDSGGKLHPRQSSRRQNAWEGNGTFDMDAGETEYVDFVRYRSQESPDGFPSAAPPWLRCSLVYNYRDIPLFGTSFTLTLMARAHEAKPTTKRFSYLMDADEPRLTLLDEIRQR